MLAVLAGVALLLGGAAGAVALFRSQSSTRVDRELALLEAEEAARAEEMRGAQEAWDARFGRRIRSLEPQLGEYYSDFVHAAHFVIHTRTADRARLRAVLNISEDRAEHLLSELHKHGIVTGVGSLGRKVLVPQRLADVLEVTPR